MKEDTIVSLVDRKIRLPVGAIRLLYEGILLQLESDLKEYGIQKDAIISLVVGMQGGSKRGHFLLTGPCHSRKPSIRIPIPRFPRSLHVKIYIKGEIDH